MDILLAMRLFVRSVESGSFSKAAATYGFKASSVSRQISSLEGDLGVTLFRRSTRQLSLTDAGLSFYDRAVSILADIEDARRSTAASIAEPTGTLRLRAPVEFGKLHLSALLPRFMTQAPGLSIDLTLADTDEEAPSAQFDFTIMIGEPADSRLYAQRFAYNRHVICCAPSYLNRAPQPDFPSALRDHNCLIHGDRTTWQFGSAKSTVEVSVEVAGNFRSNTLEPILAATLAGTGFARLPLWIAGNSLRNGDLRVVLDRYEAKSSDSAIYGLYPEKRSLSPKIRSFIEFMIGELGTPPHWDI